MQLARVRKRIVATQKHPAYRGAKIFVLETVNPQGEPTGETLVALDMVDSGVGDLVLACSEGRWAREQFGESAPIRSTIVGVISGVEVEIDAAANA